MVRALAFVIATLAVGGARADDLTALAQVHRACEAPRDQQPAPLYTVATDPAIRLRVRGETVVVDTRRNLPALEGHASILLTGLEPIAFEVGERAASIASIPDARLRLGFFLGFDAPQRQACLVRNAHAVTIVRADLAFAELLDARGARLARMETDRLAAWRDDGGATIEGRGPRGMIGRASLDGGAVPEAWQRALESAAIRGRLAQCHAEGIARGASTSARAVVRLSVETRSGRVRRAEVALSSLGDDEEAQCIAAAIAREAALPAAPGPTEALDLSVPVILTAD